MPTDVVAVGGDGADLSDLSVRRDLLGVLLEIGDDGLDGHVDAALEIHRVHASGHSLGALTDDRLGQDRRGRGAVAGVVVLTRCDLTDHLRAHVLELVGELDLLGDGDAVLGDTGSAEALLDHDIAALGTERDLDGIGENVDAAQHLVARVGGETDFFGSHWPIPSSSMLQNGA